MESPHHLRQYQNSKWFLAIQNLKRIFQPSPSPLQMTIMTETHRCSNGPVRWLIGINRIKYPIATWRPQAIQSPLSVPSKNRTSFWIYAGIGKVKLRVRLRSDHCSVMGYRSGWRHTSVEIINECSFGPWILHSKRQSMGGCYFVIMH